jgi:hypothetical protein
VPVPRGVAHQSQVVKRGAIRGTDLTWSEQVAPGAGPAADLGVLVITRELLDEVQSELLGGRQRESTFVNRRTAITALLPAWRLGRPKMPPGLQ